MFETFVQRFGPPRAATGIRPEDLGWASADLDSFSAEVGGGIFADGLISVLSVRERLKDLGGWERWLPQGSCVFATTAFGFLFTASKAGLWTVNTQEGIVLESDFSAGELLLTNLEPEAETEILRVSLFENWRKMAGPLPDESVLIPTPAIALGGTWTASSLNVVSLPVYLSLTAQLFDTEGDSPVKIIGLDD